MYPSTSSPSSSFGLRRRSDGSICSRTRSARDPRSDRSAIHGPVGFTASPPDDAGRLAGAVHSRRGTLGGPKHPIRTDGTARAWADLLRCDTRSVAVRPRCTGSRRRARRGAHLYVARAIRIRRVEHCKRSVPGCAFVAPEVGFTGIENGGVLANSAVPARALYVQTKVIRTATASERPSVGPGRARDNEPARIPLWPPGQHEVPTNGKPRCQPARPEARPNQRLYVPLGSPPSVAVGSNSARAAHRSRAPRNDTAHSHPMAARRPISRSPCSQP